MHEQNLECHPKQKPAEVLLALRDQIIDDWATRARAEVKQAFTLEQPNLINALPKLVNCIARGLASSSALIVHDECQDLALVHGEERAKISDYNPDELVQEYCIFCEVLINALDSAADLTLNDFQIIYKVIGIALQNSMIAYSDVQTDFRERFIATLAHDLRGPLGIARTAAELISLECYNPEEICFLAERLQSNLKRADDLMQSLLDVAYMHSGYELNYQMEAIDLKHLIGETVQGLSLTHGNRFVVIGDQVVGYWNRSAMRRSLENLLSNAIKYGEHDRPITVEFIKLEENVEIKVHNDGRPIPVADQKKIFQPFKREKTVITSKPGWGLGLCFVQTAAESHGGSVSVVSDVESGTDFIVRLPIDSRSAQQELHH